VFAHYVLATAIGPIGPQASIGPWGPVSTSLGTLRVTSTSNLIFQATTPPSLTPAPASLYLCLIGMAGLLVYLKYVRNSVRS
jgi:hypothetical protein